MFNFPLWSHQKETIAFSEANPRVYDASDPGTGKTRAHLEVFAKRRRQGGGRALVVAPLSLLKSAWGNDAAKYTPDMVVSYAYAGKHKCGMSNREVAFKEKSDIVMINTDGVRWLTETPYAIRNLKGFDTVVVDEITYFKHRTSARSKAMKQLAKRFSYRYGLSGTPRTNSVTDLWHQMLLLDDGAHFGHSFSKFRSQMCVSSHNGFGTDWEDRPNANALAMHLIHNMMIRHKFDVVMDVPPNYTRTINFDLPPKLRKAYDTLEKEALLYLSNTTVTAVNAAATISKLLQICSGAVYGEDRNYDVISTARYELALDLVAARDHSVVFFNWKHQRDELARLAANKKRGIPYGILDGDTPHKKREAVVDAFQRGDLQTLFVQPETGAHGLTLTKGRTTIWLGPQYKPDIAKQGLHRIYRGGQTHKTETIMILAPGTVEELVYAKLHTKSEGMDNLLGLIEELQQQRRAR